MMKVMLIDHIHRGVYRENNIYPLFSLVFLVQNTSLSMELKHACYIVAFNFCNINDLNHSHLVC